jgi:hypothetical protein
MQPGHGDPPFPEHWKMQLNPMRLAVISAANLGYGNPGMLTVDLAAAAVLKRSVPNSVLSWYTLHPPDQLEPVHSYVNPAELPFRWRPLVDDFEEVSGHDVILLWGDFLQARHYFVQDAVERLIRSSKGTLLPDQALTLLYKCLLFSESPPDVLNKIVIFGSTMLFNRETDYSVDRYAEFLTRLVRNCAGVWVREPVSAAKVQHLMQEYRASPLGTDPAFLLRDGDLACLSTTPWLDGAPFNDRVGLFLGTRTRPSRELMAFLRELARQREFRLEWLPWFPVHEWLQNIPGYVWLNPVLASRLSSRRRAIRRLMIRGTKYSAGDLLTAVQRYRFIVTDTYHLCVNAWRVGTPAFCFGSDEPSDAGRLQEARPVRHVRCQRFLPQPLIHAHGCGQKGAR